MPDQWKQDFRTATFLTRRGDDFSFAHSSLLEYFLAKRLADSLATESEGEALETWDITRPSDETFAFFAEIIDRFSAPAQRQALARLEHVGTHASASARANVFAYTLRALEKGAPHPRPDALNLADTDLRGWTVGSEKTPLILAGVSLRSARLDDARIRHARLDGIDRLIRFFDHVVGNGRMRLLAVPWAAARCAKRRYRGHELIERGMMLRMRRPFKRVLMLRCRHAMLLLSSSIN